MRVDMEDWWMMEEFWRKVSWVKRSKKSGC